MFSKKQFGHTKWIGLSGLFFCLLIISCTVRGHSRLTGFGYSDKGDSIEFLFGQQNKMVISGVEVMMKDRFSEIKEVTVAGDFNNWNPKDRKYKAIRVTIRYSD